ncbi:putative transporter [Campylobacter troglodytis]|uniref:putative transporter n=1 Tax=Campylobacter troglodytis TaxID=654363 RepID=UPI0011574C5B|nr:putative transporter [Campylobacter troglodytis]TQR59576.1 putative transporter [Campylobacter troglodytis]
MFRSFFGSKEWFLWAYSGLFLLLFFLYLQTSLNVAINEWYKDFYDLLQKPKIESLQDQTQSLLQTENKALEAQIKQAEEKIQNANFLNKISLHFYQFLIKNFFNTPSISGQESYNINDFYALIGVFLCIALPYVVIATINIYFASVYAFKWREAMTFEYLNFWKNKDDNIEGSSQRIQEDIYNFSKIVESLGLAFIRALMTLIAFIPILWLLSGDISKSLFEGISDESIFAVFKHIDGLLVYVALFISLGGLVISWFVGIKLPGLEYNNQKAEAAFRKELVYAEDDRRNYAATETMIELFTGLKFNYKRLFLHYGYFNIWLILFEQIIIIVPFLIVAPALFAGAIGLGIVMQMSNAFAQVRSSFSVFITNWTKITELRSIHKRLSEFEENIEYKKKLKARI